eukprot:g1864.t2
MFRPLNSASALRLKFPKLTFTDLLTDYQYSILRQILSASVGEEFSGRKILEVGLIGIPNAGKSELVNHLVGHKISAVSSKQNTTVTSHLGAFEVHQTQVVLYDLPGIVRRKDARFKGQLARVQSAWTTATDCDVITFIVDAASIVNRTLRGGARGKASNKWDGEVTLAQSKFRSMPVFDLARQLNGGVLDKRDATRSPVLLLALNKIDLLDRNERYKLAHVEELFRQCCAFRETFHISALSGIGVPALKTYFNSMARDGEWIIPGGSKTDKSPGELAVELVREKLYRRLNKELPYILEPELVTENVSETGVLVFEVLIRVPSDSVKKIVIGQRGTIIQNVIAYRMLAPREAATDDEEEFQQDNVSEVDSLASVNSEASEVTKDVNKDSINFSGHVLDSEESPLVSENNDERKQNPEKSQVEEVYAIKDTEVLDRDVQLPQTTHESSSGAIAAIVESKDEEKEIETESEGENKTEKTAEGVLEVKRKSQQKPFDIPTTGDFYMHDDRFTSANIPTTIHRQKPSQVSGGVGINASRWKHDKFEEMEKEHERRSTQKEDGEIPTFLGRWLKNNELPSRGRGRRGSRFQAPASNRGRGRSTGAPSRGYRGGGRTYSGRFGSTFSQHPSTQSNTYSTANLTDNGWRF